MLHINNRLPFPIGLHSVRVVVPFARALPSLTQPILTSMSPGIIFFHNDIETNLRVFRKVIFQIVFILVKLQYGKTSMELVRSLIYINVPWNEAGHRFTQTSIMTHKRPGSWEKDGFDFVSVQLKEDPVHIFLWLSAVDFIT